MEHFNGMMIQWRDISSVAINLATFSWQDIVKKGRSESFSPEHWRRGHPFNAQRQWTFATLLFLEQSGRIRDNQRVRDNQRIRDGGGFDFLLGDGLASFRCISFRATGYDQAYADDA
ncbi:MAG: hypothetical protein ONB11_10305 [candidate division KSB1 bacterium]|nr:hypothetical protein [candidate division KSB1 bacterium]MDZ7342433.1 hypothetical protein [candidate division KSB1 bacterium]